RTFQNFLLFCGSIFCFAVLLSAGYFIWGIYMAKAEPPRAHLQVGDKELSIPVDVVKQLEALKLTLVPTEILQQLAALKAEMERVALTPGAPPIPGTTNLFFPTPSDAGAASTNGP